MGGLLIEVYVCIIITLVYDGFSMFSLISDHDLLAILSRGYVYSRFISFNVLLLV